MSDFFPIFQLSNHVGPNIRQDETMGTKRKVWLVHKNTERKILLKFATPGTGEDWSEKVAHEIASLLGIPGPPLLHLATCHGAAATLSWSFLRRGESLIHGNELLGEIDPDYPQGPFYHVRQHSLGAVEAALRGVEHPPVTRLPTLILPGADGLDVFLGYLMLDALIGNTELGARRPDAYRIWTRHLRSTGLVAMSQTIDRVPPARLSETGKRFAKDVLRYNFERITDMKDDPSA